jgi:hypothetical protein
MKGIMATLQPECLCDVLLYVTGHFTEPWMPSASPPKIWEFQLRTRKSGNMWWRLAYFTTVISWNYRKFYQSIMLIHQKLKGGKGTLNYYLSNSLDLSVAYSLFEKQQYNISKIYINKVNLLLCHSQLRFIFFRFFDVVLFFNVFFEVIFIL